MTSILKLNDASFKRFIITISSFQLVVLGVIGIEALGLPLPFIRQAVTFIYLSFVPGIVILRIFRIHGLSTAENLCYAVGLSISSVMLFGVLLSTMAPLLGNTTPLTAVPLIITLTIGVLGLCLVSYLRDKDFFSPSSRTAEAVPLSPMLFLLLILLVSILGAYVLTFYHSNYLLLLLMVLITLVVILVAFNRFVPMNLYPVAIFVIALALVYHRSLVTPYLLSTDVTLENYFTQLTLLNGYWDSIIPNAYNAMLSVTILPSVYSLFLNIDSTWIFKIVYPILFSMVPLILYEAYRKQVGNRVGFLAAFFFMTPAMFSGIGATLAKQSIAEIFLALLILLTLDKRIGGSQKSLLMICFGFSLIVSHYGTAIIYVFSYLLLPWLLLWIWSAVKRSQTSATLSGWPVVVFLVISFGWYAYIGGGNILLNATGRITHIYSQLSEVWNPFVRETTVQLLLGATPLASLGHEISRVFHYIWIFLCIGGLIQAIQLWVRGKKVNFESPFLAMSLVATLILFAQVAVPLFSSLLGLVRFYHLSLLLLAPFVFTGGEEAFNLIRRLFKPLQRYQISSAHIILVTLMVVLPIFLYDVGFIYEVTGDVPSSSVLSSERMKQSDHIDLKINYESEHLETQDVYSSRWLGQRRNPDIEVFSGRLPHAHILPSYAMIYPAKIISSPPEIGYSYIYLSRMNVVDNILIARESGSLTYGFPVYSVYDTFELVPQLANKIYTNGGSEIWLHVE